MRRTLARFALFFLRILLPFNTRLTPYPKAVRTKRVRLFLRRMQIEREKGISDCNCIMLTFV